MRNPSARCGVPALKPSYGALSRHGLIPLTHSLDVPGLIALTVDDLANLLLICAGKDPMDSTSIDTSEYITPESMALEEAPSIEGLKVRLVLVFIVIVV